VPSCGSDAVRYTGLSYQYNLFKSGIDTNIKSVSLSTRNFRLEEFILDPGTEYTLVLTVTTDNGISSSSAHIFSVGMGSTLAVISQGSFTTVSETSVRSIDATQSYNLDNPADHSDLAYSWECVQSSPVFGVPCFETFPDLSTINFDAEKFNATYEYQLTVTVRNMLVLNSTSTASIVLRVTPGPPRPLLEFWNKKGKYNYDERILLSGHVYIEGGYTSAVALWSAADSSGVGIDLESIVLTDLSKTLSPGTTDFGLTISKLALVEGSTYTFRLAASYVLGNSVEAAEAHGDVLIVINERPSGGSFAVTPSEGESLETIFFFHAFSWQDDVDDYPLEYRFASYASTPSNANLVRDYSSVSYVNAYIGQGLDMNGFNVTGIGWVVDTYGLGISSIDTITVFPQADSATLLEAALALANTTAGNPELTQQILNALTANFNAVDCSLSSSSSCSLLNREACSLTVATCGPCLAAFPVGQAGDSNGPCLANPFSGNSPRDNYVSPLFAAMPISSNVAADEGYLLTLDDIGAAAKACPADCSNRGQCVFYDWGGMLVSSCTAVDSSCRAACVCDAGSYAWDCALDLAEYTLGQQAKEYMCAIAYDAKDSVDVSAVALQSRAALVSRTLQDTTLVTDNAYLNCSLLLLESILEYPALSVTDTAMDAVLNGLSSILEFGQRMPENVYYDLILALQTISEYRPMVMSTGEEPIAVYTRNLRYFTSAVYLGELVNTTIWRVTQSALEATLGANASSAVILNADAINGTVPNTVFAVAISVWELLVDTGYNTGNASAIHVQTNNLISTSGLINTASSSLSVSLYNHEPVKYGIDEIVYGTAICFARSSRIPYEMNVECGDGSLETITCPGNVSVTVHYTCTYDLDLPVCLSWDGVEYSVDSECSLDSYNAYTSVCRCDHDVSQARRNLQSSGANSTGPQDFDFISTKKVVTVNLQMDSVLLTEEPYFNREYIVPFAGALGLTLVSLLGGAWLLKSHKANHNNAASAYAVDRQTLDVSPGYVAVIQLADAILRPNYEHPTNILMRSYKALLLNSEYLSVFRWKSDATDAIYVELFEKWFLLAGYILSFMSVHAVLAWLLYQDDGYCQEIFTEDRCTEQPSTLGLKARCAWRADGHPYCHMRDPLDDALTVFVLVAATALLVLPLNHFWAVAMEGVSTRVSSACRSTASATVAVLSSDNNENNDNNENEENEENDIDSSPTKKAVKSMESGLNATNKFYKASSKVMIVNEGVKAGTVEEELIYVISEAKSIVISKSEDQTTLPDNPAPAVDEELHRTYLMTELGLDAKGNIRERGPLKPRERIKKTLRRAREHTGVVLDTMDTFSADELLDCYLIEQFLLFCLPESMRYYATRYFFNSTGQYVRSGASIAIYHYCYLLLPLYIILALAPILFIGIQWYGRVTNLTWGYLVLANVVLDCFVNTPFRICLRDRIIPATFMDDLRRVHALMRLKYPLITKSMQDEARSPAFELVQHCNPSCRAARESAASTPVTDTLMWVADTDLIDIALLKSIETKSGEHLLPGIWNSLTRLVLAAVRGTLVGIFLFVPGMLVDFVINLLGTASILAMLCGLVYLWLTMAAHVAAIVLTAVVVVVALREYFSAYRTPRHADERSRERAHAAEAVLARLLACGGGGGRGGMAGPEDLAAIREALLSPEAATPLDSYTSLKLSAKPSSPSKVVPSSPSKVVPINSQSKVVPINSQSKVVPIDAGVDLSESTKVDKALGNVHLEKPKAGPVAAAGSSADPRARADSFDSLTMKTPKRLSRGSLLEPISLSKTPGTGPGSGLDQVSGLSSVSTLKGGGGSNRMHISGKDYQILTTAVARYLHKREKAEGDEYRGTQEGEVVQWVVQKSLDGNKNIINSEVKFAIMVKKETKILRKIIKRMIEKDKSLIVVTMQAEEGRVEKHGKYFRLTPVDKVRKQLLAKTPSKQLKAFLASAPSDDEVGSSSPGKARNMSPVRNFEKTDTPEVDDNDP
jgi:hypothetical protein